MTDYCPLVELINFFRVSPFISSFPFLSSHFARIPSLSLLFNVLSHILYGFSIVLRQNLAVAALI